MDKVTEIQVDDRTIPCYMAHPEAGTGLGVIVLHAWWGLNDFFKELCEQLAQEGFVTIAPDLYGDGITASTIAEAEQFISDLDFEEAQAKAISIVNYLRRRPAVQGKRIGVIGFSMGAALALLLSTLTPEDIAAVVIFYGTGEADFTKAQAAYLGHYAEHDEWEPEEGVRRLETQLRAAGKSVVFHTYPGTGHWFFEANQSDAYDAEAGRLAWERTINFLQAQL